MNEIEKSKQSNELSLYESLGIVPPKTKKIFHIIGGHIDHVESVCYSPDGLKILSGSWDNTIKEWDVKTGRCIRTLTGHTGWVTSVCYSPDGVKILSGDDYTIKEWDVKTGKCIQTLTGHTGWVNSVCYSPDGLKILSGSSDDTIKEWDVKTGRCIQTFSGHTDYVTSVCYSPDGSKVLSGSGDHTIKIWDVSMGICLATCYNVDEGFLWTTPPDEVAPYGWIWTDREDLISIVKAFEDGSCPESVEDQNEERQTYLKDYNRKDMVMARLNDFKRYQTTLWEIMTGKIIIGIEHLSKLQIEDKRKRNV